MHFFLKSSPVVNTSRLFRNHAFSTFTRQTARDVNASSRRGWSGRPRRPSGVPDLAPGKLYDITEPSFVNREEPTRKQKAKTNKANKTYDTFRRLSLAYFDDFLKQNSWDKNKEEFIGFGTKTSHDFEQASKQYRQTIINACDLASQQPGGSRKDNPLFWSLRNAFVQSDVPGLKVELKYGFQNFLMHEKFTPQILSAHQQITDMRYPYEWFPATRALHRKVYLHVGPTNSGKTYNALKALENAKTGIYAGPLRLLAHEVYTRFMAKGKKCALITGEEQRIPTDTDLYFRSCTVEMAPLNLHVDVAIIDEIQMIGDAERGWAWTQAFLGLQAKELHLCGEERAVELIQSLCASLGDECTVTRYERLSPLETMSESLGGKLSKLQKGDAVVSFSRIGIHSLKNQIQKYTGKRCAIVYGSLPPETRAAQAALFNDPNNDYDYLVASDAIGMGLNLEIKRVVFETTLKRDSSTYRQISDSEIRQIGGRAGRFRTANHAIQSTASEGEPASPEAKPPGLVTALNNEDLVAIIKAFNAQLKPIETAGIQPPTAALERFSTYFPPNIPLSFILLRFRDIAKLSPRFHVCSTKEMLEIADLIQPFPMTIYDRCVFLNAPASIRDKRVAKVLQALARCVSRMQGGDILEIPEIELDLLAASAADQRDKPVYLERLESLHKAITLYLWLSYRFTGVFTSQHLAFHIKELVEIQINDQLSGVTQSAETRRKRLESIRKTAQARQLQQAQLLAEDNVQHQEVHEGTV